MKLRYARDIYPFQLEVGDLFKFYGGRIVYTVKYVRVLNQEYDTHVEYIKHGDYTEKLYKKVMIANKLELMTVA